MYVSYAILKENTFIQHLVSLYCVSEIKTTISSHRRGGTWTWTPSDQLQLEDVPALKPRIILKEETNPKEVHTEAFSLDQARKLLFLPATGAWVKICTEQYVSSPQSA